MFRVTFAVAAAGLATAATGCSTVGGLFGVSPPQFKLTDETVALRDAQSAAPAPIPKELNKALLPAFVVEPGDTLLVQPADLDSPVRLPGDQVVLPDGTIDLGRFGRPVVAGKTLAVIESELRGVVLAGLRDIEKEAARTRKKDETAPTDAEITRNSLVNVRLVGRASKVYYVLGEVNAPGAFPLTGRETVLDGIIAAGNLTRKGSTRNVVLARPTTVDGCRMVLPICLDEIEQQADPSTNYQLQPGDRIYVPSKGLLEDFHARRKKTNCGPCGHGKMPCPLGSACGTITAPACDAVPVSTAVSAPAAGLPAVTLPEAPLPTQAAPLNPPGDLPVLPKESKPVDPAPVPAPIPVPTPSPVVPKEIKPVDPVPTLPKGAGTLDDLPPLPIGAATPPKPGPTPPAAPKEQPMIPLIPLGVLQ